MLLKKRDTAARIGYRSMSSLERLMQADPTFPRPVKMGAHRQSAALFDATEVDAWIERRKAARPCAPVQARAQEQTMGADAGAEGLV